MQTKLLFIIAILSFASCTQSTQEAKERRAEAIEKKNEAIDLMLGFTEEPGLWGKEKAKKVLVLVDESIAIDSTFMRAYILKSQLLIEEDRYEDAIDVLNIALQYQGKINQAIDKEDITPNVYLMRGVIWERIDSLSNARNDYQEAIHLLESMLKKDPNNFYALLNLALMDVFYNSKEKALEKLNNLKEKDLSERECQIVDLNISTIRDINSREEFVRTITFQ